MRNLLTTLTLVALCFLPSLILPLASDAATLNVPIPYGTIQAALTAASPDDIIVVAAGIYTENNLLVDKGITLQGAGKATTFIDATASGDSGSVVQIDLTSGNVLVDGFTIKTGANNGVYAKSTSSGSTITISHNRIEGFAPSSTADNFGLIAGYGSEASLVFTYNEITNCDGNSILLERHVGPTDVSYNTFDRNPSNIDSDAYFNMSYGGTDITSLQKVSHNLIDMGAGTVFTYDTRGCGITFTGSFPDPGGIGGYTNIEITDNVIYNLKPYRRGITLWNGSTGSGSDGDFVDPVIARNTIIGTAGNPGQYGIRLLGHATDAVVTNNAVERVDYGFRAQLWNGHIATGTVVNNNSLRNCTLYGMYVDSAPDVDGEDNWWGDASGPTPTGTGSRVSSYVDFTPWVTTPNAISVVPAYTLTDCSQKKTVTFHIAQEAPIDVRGYEVKFEVNTSIATVASLSDIKEEKFLSSVDSTMFFATGGGGGGGVKTYTVSCAIMGGTTGGKGAGDLFTVDLTPVAQGTSAITVTSVKVRDINNNPLPSSSVGGSIQVDCTAPTMEAIAEAQGGWYNTAPSFSNFGFDDDLNLDLADYRIDAGDWTTLFSGIDTVEWNSDGWVLPGFGGFGSGLSEGSHTVYFQVKDDAGNWNAGTISWQFYKDTVLPAPPTNFVAMPGHNKTHLTWTNPSGDPTFDKVEIRFNPWGDYPEYGTPGPGAPSYPANNTEGTFVSLVAGASYDDNPRAPRDIYYYSAFSKDRAGNYSALGTTAKDRSTSYWLGDVTADGKVDINDLTPFSNAFGQIPGGGGWNNLCDFGPTDDWSRFGIPLPDNTIEFEDLMIFAMNWETVLPSGMGRVLAAGATERLRDLVEFGVVWLDDNTVSIVLKNQASTLKGIHLVIDITSGELLSVERGSLVSGKGEFFFGTVPGEGADISVAALGVGVALSGSGEVVRLHVKQAGDAPSALRFRAVDLRSVDNDRDEVIVSQAYEAPFIPKATVLMQNYPNPFNPLTTLSYDLAKAGHVTLQIFDVTGRVVRMLVDERKEAGRYSVEWDGRDGKGAALSSGIYFYRMVTADYSATQKMIMVR